MLLPLAAMAQTTQPATLSGSVKGLGDKPIVVLEQIGENTKPDTLRLTSKGTFNKDVQIEESSTTFLNIYVGGERVESLSVRMKPGKSLTVDVNKGKNGELKVKYGGDTGVETEFENASRKLFTLSDTFSEAKIGSFANFIACRDYVDAQIATLDKPLSRVKDKDYVAQQKLEMEQGRVGHYFNYAVIRQKNGFDMTRDKAFMDYVKTVDMNDTTQLRAIMGYLDWLITATPDTTNLPNDALKLRLLKSVTQNQAVRNKIAGDILSMQFFAQMFGADLSETLPYVYKEFLEVSTDKAWRDYVTKELAQIENQKSGKEAYALPLHTLDGTQTTLKDIVGEGKYTYVDFWATWCGPCKKEIPYLARLAEKYENAPVRFVSISMDEDVSKWETMIKKDNPQWPQYRATKEGQRLCEDIYGIKGIPRFMLFDKEGRMMQASAPRPSDKQMEELLETLK